ncbi:MULTISPECIES: transporter substrate-binding domain-containing protein [Aerococcus]|uniref:Transporter substrate-binding domain-containing protein n=1 Tax=Aerococcus mictus TaxID=2976810 RepID=A0A1E9PAD1_9LACT|nr:MULTISPECIES: transporter substrate-binding domain-containing protein [Aerococcus]KAA9234505.1 transporter substrate-binding domain-containing protein [Aerococcus mictus]KAA9291841.1 transporter substrate-binding domain-containing protein [Aerococcus mictus]MBU5610068.1 transporter substrate-binding domain-containing protein [Aerococcus urinae]MCY3034771.1 transporter substrate-binding domain-containing protein [Aerococcus mictus]MCY3064105.1 transporter substrate-binding domain-containing 
MKTLKTFIIVLAGLFLAACGNNQGGSESGAKTVTVAVENASKPLSFTDEKGNLTGYEVELIQALDEAMPEYNINIESVDSEAAQVGLETGQYDFIGGGLYKNPERESMYLFPEKHTGASVIEIYKRADDDSIQSLDDLTDKKVHPVTPNGGIFNLLTAYNEAHPDNQIDIQLGESGSFAERFQAVDKGESDAVVMPSNLGADQIIEELGLNVNTADQPVQVKATYFMIAPDREDLKEALDKAIQQLADEGKLQELSEKWYGKNIFDYEISEEN